MCSSLSFGQNDYRPGFVVLNDGDTLKGEIIYREGRRANQVCTFRSGNVTEREFLPTDIISYGFLNDKVYRTWQFEQVGNLKADETFPSDPVFVEILTKGKISLYLFESTFFVQDSTDAKYQLINSSREVVENGRRYLKESRQYIGLLKYIMQDCQKLQNRIEGVKLLERELTQLVELYNECGGTVSVSYKKDKQWMQVQFGPAVGYQTSSIQFSDRILENEHLSGSWQSSNQIIPAFLIDISSPRIQEHFGLTTGVIYIKDVYNSNNILEKNFFTDYHDVSITIEQLKIPFGLSYKLNEGKITPYFMFGMSFSAYLSKSSNWILERDLNGTVNTFESEAFEIKGSQFGIWGGAGIEKVIFPKVIGFAEVRFERTNGVIQNLVNLSGNEGTRSAINNFQVVVGIKFRS